MSKTNEHTGDRITNALKGDKDKYRENWEAIFGSKDMKKHVQQITCDTPHTVVEDADEILDGVTQMNEDMGLYDDK